MHLIRCHGLVHLWVSQMVSNLIFSHSGQFFFLPVRAFAICDLGSVAGALVVKTEANKLLSTSAFSISQVARSPVSFQRGTTFFLVFLLSLTYL